MRAITRPKAQLKAGLFASALLAIFSSQPAVASSFSDVRHDDVFDYPADGLPAGIYACAGSPILKSPAGTSEPSVLKCRSQATADVAIIEARRKDLISHPEQVGCLGKDQVTCLASLSLGLVITNSADLTSKLIDDRPSVRDIYGKAQSRVLILDAYVPENTVPPRPIVFIVELQDGEHIGAVHFRLLSSPALARTEQEWKDTGVFEIASGVLGQPCVGIDRVAFYKSYHELSMHMTGQATGGGSYADPTVSTPLSASENICGVNMSVGHTEGISLQSGAFGHDTLDFSDSRFSH